MKFRDIIASIIAFFAGSGTAILIDEEKQTVTLDKDQAKQLNDSIAQVQTLQTENQRLTDSNAQLQRDYNTIAGSQTALEQRIDAIGERLGLEQAEGQELTDEALHARIDFLMQLPGSAGSHQSGEGDDDLGDGGPKEPVYSWEKKAAKVDARNKKRHNLN
jgi:hypothetical protein